MRLEAGPMWFPLSSKSVLSFALCYYRKQYALLNKFIVAKHRHGHTSTVRLQFNKHNMLWQDSE